MSEKDSEELIDRLYNRLGLSDDRDRTLFIDVGNKLRMADKLEEKYNELLYEVARKFPYESRHDTARRYIQEAEAKSGHVAKQCEPKSPACKIQETEVNSHAENLEICPKNRDRNKNN